MENARKGMAILVCMLAAGGTAWGQAPTQQGPLDLKHPPRQAVVVRAAHCTEGYFRLDFLDGARRDVPEINLRLKIDTSPKGPALGVMVKLGAGMAGDRASLVFASLADLKRLLREGCEN